MLGFAVGQIYADRYLSPGTKAQVEAMVVNIIAAFRRRIDALSSRVHEGMTRRINAS